MNMISRRYALVPVCLMWLGTLAAALIAASFRDLGWHIIWPIAAVAAAPAILALILIPVLHKEWAQILVILGWLALAVVAVLGVSFTPMAILFMCAPAAAALFEREKVVEAMVMAAILAAVLFYAGQLGLIPDSLTDGRAKDWGQQLGIFATLAFLVGSLMVTAYSRGELMQKRFTPSESELASSEIAASEKNISPAASLSASSPAGVKGSAADLDMVPGDFFILNAQNHIQQVNQNARENFDLYEHGGAEFTTMLGLHETGAKSISDLISRARKTGAEQSGHFLMTTNTETPNYLRVTVRPLDDGRAALSLHNLNETHQEIKRLQLDKEKARQDTEEKSLFFAGVSHELRTPLNAIIGFSDMMRSRLFGPLPNKYAEYADMIHDSGQHMLDLIGDVLDMSKVEAGKYELKYDRFLVEDIIRSSLKMVQPTADSGEVALQADMSGGEDMLIHADRRALRQILLNLLTNAIKFSPKGSIIRAVAAPMGDKMRISIIDQGAGMSPEFVKQIGQPYIPSDESHISDTRGTGLGLSLVKSLVDLHKGQMSVDSQVGRGTTIHIDLPIEHNS